MPRKTRRLPRVLAWTELKPVVSDERHVRNRAILSLLAYAGVLRGEVVGLESAITPAPANRSTSGARGTRTA